MVRKRIKKNKSGTIDEIIYNPTSIKLMAKQIILAADGYIAKKISENAFKELIMHYASRHGKMLFSGDGINPTILNRIGKKRTKLVNIMLEGFQKKIF